MNFETKQNFTSAETSINSGRLPAIYNKVTFPAGAVVIDYGCGKYTEHIIDRVNEYGATWAGYDPFNRTDSENAGALEIIKNGAADFAVCSNVLNVIDSDSAMMDVIRNVCSAAKTAIFSIYEGNGTGTGRPSKNDCYQLNMKTREYLKFFENLGLNATMKKGLIYVG